MRFIAYNKYPDSNPCLHAFLPARPCLVTRVCHPPLLLQFPTPTPALSPLPLVHFKLPCLP